MKTAGGFHSHGTIDSWRTVRPANAHLTLGDRKNCQQSALAADKQFVTWLAGRADHGSPGVNHWHVKHILCWFTRALINSLFGVPDMIEVFNLASTFRSSCTGDLARSSNASMRSPQLGNVPKILAVACESASQQVSQ